jgi:hypothetical protein
MSFLTLRLIIYPTRLVYPDPIFVIEYMNTIVLMSFSLEVLEFEC